MMNINVHRNDNFVIITLRLTNLFQWPTAVIVKHLLRLQRSLINSLWQK